AVFCRRTSNAAYTNGPPKENELIAREGFSTIGIVALLVVAVIVLSRGLTPIPRIILIVLAVALLTLVTFFFRDPDRSLPAGVDSSQVLVAPADGKVIDISEISDNDYVGGPSKQLSIFLSVFDVHVNRVPASGIIEQADYYPGDYLVAWHPKSSEFNERAEFGLRHETGTRILFRQITGMLARRIVYSIEVEDRVSAGERFGIMKFGSRMDVVVPSDFELLVNVGDRVVGGHTVLGYFDPDQ
ncbi:MAG: phosphatidylserine decarboxylase family protein, partial [Rhodothermia bacterium]